MNCTNCNAQIASTEIYCPFCGEVNEKGASQPVVNVPEPIRTFRCLHCNEMIALGSRFCGSCGREQVLAVQPKKSNVASILGWSCGGCLGLIIISGFIIQAWLNSLFHY